MKFIFKIVIAFYVLIPNISRAQKYIGEFTKLEFSLSRERMNFFADMFETKKQMLDFMEISKGDVIAEVGADDGWNLGVLSMLYDSITLFAQDINTKALTQKSWNKTIAFYEKHRKIKQTNKFNWTIGTISSTNLPDGAFNKILIIDAYHDFDKKDEMIEDLAKKLKPSGKIYILDGFSFPGDTQVCPDNGKHILTTLPVEIERFEKHGFYLIKMRGPDYKSHYGNGVIFERNKSKSDEYYRKKKEIDPFVTRTAGFIRKDISSDSLTVKTLTDSTLPKIKEITNVYPEYEVWLKDIGLKYLRSAEYQSAINIFKANTTFFPDSYQSWYWLGVAYQENKQNSLAHQNLKLSLALDPGNSNAAKRIKALKK